MRQLAFGIKVKLGPIFLKILPNFFFNFKKSLNRLKIRGNNKRKKGFGKPKKINKILTKTDQMSQKGFNLTLKASDMLYPRKYSALQFRKIHD